MRVGLIQMAVPGSVEQAEAKAEAFVVLAAQSGAEVICLPELYRTPYFCQKEDISLFDLAETVPGPSYSRFKALAEKLEVAIIVPIFEKRASGVYHNTALTFDGKKGLVGYYRKMHIPDDPNYYEKFYFTPGDLGFSSAPLAKGRVGTLICWDQWYPEAARLTAMQGAEMIFYPTAIGYLPQDKEVFGAAQRDAWVTMQRSHAIANGVFVAAVNRVGVENGLEFWGTSFVCGPDGTILAEASAHREEIIYATVDLAQVEFVRREWPFFRDRRIDSFAGLTQRFGF